MQTSKDKKRVFSMSFVKDWQAIDYLRASLCLPFVALGLSSLHPLMPPMLISFIGLGIVTIIMNFSAGIEFDVGGSMNSYNLRIAKYIPFIGLPLLGIAIIGFLVGSMFWMGLGLSLLILFGFPAVAVFGSFGYFAWVSFYERHPQSNPNQFTMATSFTYSAMFGFYIATIGGVIRLVPIAIQVQ